jgi:putative DNA primase/helicase
MTDININADEYKPSDDSKGLLEAALDYKRRGWPVFTVHTIKDGRCSCGDRNCGSPGKHPWTPHGHSDATIDERDIREQWAAHPEANIGVYCHGAGFIGLDCDDYAGGRETLAKYPPLPKTVTQDSGSGKGQHFLYKRRDGKKYRGTLGQGTTIKDEGYILLAPSVHLSGGSYRWILGCGPGEIEMAEAPAWLEVEGENNPHIKSPPAPIPARIPAGIRRTTFLSMLGSMVSRGASEAAVSEAILGLNRTQCDPPLDESELKPWISREYHRYAPRHVARPESKGLPKLNGAPETDAANAQRLVHWFGDDIRHVAEWGWITWQGTRWERTLDDYMFPYAIKTAQEITLEAEGLRATKKKGEKKSQKESRLSWAAASQSSQHLRAMVTIAASLVKARPEEFDRAPYLFNVLNGTLDLRSGEKRPQSRDDYITLLAPHIHDPTAKCPRFVCFLREIMDGDEELANYLARWIGYTITGETKEQALLLLHGEGGHNGKSRLLTVLRALLGDYARTAAFDAFVGRRWAGSTRDDLVDLRGARLVCASEGDESTPINETLVKKLTGQDEVSCRAAYEKQAHITFMFKAWLASNEYPKIRGQDDSIWRRIKRVPFKVSFTGEKDDKNLAEKLTAELPGLLNLAIREAGRWYKEGIPECAKVSAAVKEYRTEMAEDVQRWIDARCARDKSIEEQSGILFTDYEGYCESRNMGPLTKNSFGRALTALGYGSRKGEKTTYRIGLALKEQRRME